MLGDDELSKRLAGVRGAGLQDEALRTRLYSTTKTRLNQLTQLSKNKSGSVDLAEHGYPTSPT